MNRYSIITFITACIAGAMGVFLSSKKEQIDSVYIDVNKNEEVDIIKGNINSKGEKIFHMPGQQYYERVIAVELFQTEQEAIEAGYRKSKR